MDVRASEATAVDPIPAAVAVDVVAALFGEHLHVLAAAELANDRCIRSRRGADVGGAGNAPPPTAGFVGRGHAPLLRVRIGGDRMSTRLNSSHVSEYRMPS